MLSGTPHSGRCVRQDSRCTDKDDYCNWLLPPQGRVASRTFHPGISLVCWSQSQRVSETVKPKGGALHTQFKYAGARPPKLYAEILVCIHNFRLLALNLYATTMLRAPASVSHTIPSDSVRWVLVCYRHSETEASTALLLYCPFNFSKLLIISVY